MSDPFGYVLSSVVTDRGLVRATNEDSFLALPDAGVFVVADGMGGGEKGEEASRWVVEEIEAALRDSQGELPGVRLMALDEAVNRSSRRIIEEARRQGYAQMGSTVAALLLDPWHAVSPCVAHVGDSRVYRWRDGTLTPLTADHTVGNEILRRTGDTSFADARLSRLSHVLTRTIGMAERVPVEWSAFDLAIDDRLLLCTDGFTTILEDARLCGLLSSSSSPQDACARLASAVRSVGAVDNYTAVVLFVKDPLPAPVSHGADDEEENDYLMRRLRP